MEQFNPELHSLSDFIRTQGGISTKKEGLKGECRDYFSIAEGYNLINNKTGKSLDHLLEAATEAGFAFFDATVADLIDMLRQDIYSKKMGKGGTVWSFAKQDWKYEIPDFDMIFDEIMDDKILELTEEFPEVLDLMPVEIFNLYYGGVCHVY